MRRALLLTPCALLACGPEPLAEDSGEVFEVRGEIEGSLGGHTFGELTTAWLIPDSTYYSLDLPLIFLADQGFSCDEIQLASATAELLRTLDPVQSWGGILLWFGEQGEDGEWSYPSGVGTWSVNSAELSPLVGVGQTVRIAGFGHGDVVELDPGYLTIEALDLESYVAGRLDLTLETGEQLSGTFEAEYCNLPGVPTVF